MADRSLAIYRRVLGRDPDAPLDLDPDAAAGRALVPGNGPGTWAASGRAGPGWSGPGA